MQALILAAGAGSRLRPLTNLLPKPLVKVGGVPMAVRQMLALQRAGVEDFVVNLGWGADRIRGMLGDGSAWGVRIRYSFEAHTAEAELETRGGIVKALPLLTDRGDDAFIVAAGDIVTDYDYRGLVEAAERLRADGTLAHLVLVPNPPYHRQGDLALTADGMLAEAGEMLTFSSLGAYHRAMFENELPVRAPLFPWMRQFIRAEHVSGERFDGLWVNVGTLEELARAEALVRSVDKEQRA